MSEGRIRQSTMFLTDVLRGVEAGQLVPASFQRPYAWGRPDVEALWTSLAKGYPIGSFLLWSPPPEVDVAALGRSRIGPVAVAPASHPTLVLDGQNRMASYVWSTLATAPDGEEVERLDGLHPLSPPERDTWLGEEALFADPVERAIRFLPRSEASRRLLLPAHALVREDVLMPYLRRWERSHGPVSDGDLYWFCDEMRRRVSEARVAVTTLERLPPGEALDAFRHVARAGVPISDEDFEAAMAFALPAAPGGPAA